MKCFVFLVCSSVDNDKVVYNLDSMHHMKSYEMLKTDKNPHSEYIQRSALIGKEHEWSIEMAKRIEHDADIVQMMELRERLNDRLSLHCVKSDYEALDCGIIKTMFNNKIESGEIYKFLKDSKL